MLGITVGREVVGEFVGGGDRTPLNMSSPVNREDSTKFFLFGHTWSKSE